MSVIHKIVSTAGLLPALRALEAGRRARQEQPRARALLSAILARIDPRPDLDDPQGWQVLRFAPTSGDITVAMIGPVGQAPVAVLKLARSTAAAANLRRYRGSVEALRRDARLPEEWRRLVPGVLGAGEAAGRAYLVEAMLPGLPLARAGERDAMRRAQRAAAAAIGQLHRATAEVVAADTRVCERLVDRRLRVVRQALAARPRAAQVDAALTRLHGELRRALEAGPVALGWVHGDFAPDNVLAAEQGALITGLIDWELAAPADLPAVDLAQLLLSSRLSLTRGELGPIVNDVLHGAGWLEHEAALLDEAAAGVPGRPLGLRPLTLLCWLRHVSDTLGKAPRYGRNRFWLAANVEQVLGQL